MHDFKDVKKILVIKLRHIGDVLLSAPVFRALRENFPGAHISALVYSGTEETLTGNPLINEIITFDLKIKKLAPAGRYLKELSFLKSLRAEGFDMAIDLTSGDRPAIISRVSGAKYRIAYDPNRDGFWGKRHLYTHLAKKHGGEHMVLQNLNIIRQFGITTENLTVDFFIPDDARAFAKKIFEENNINPYTSPEKSPHPPFSKGGRGGISKRDIAGKVVHAHPSSRWLFKCWKDEYMAGVISWLLEQGVKVIVTSSPDKKEMDKTKKILSLVDSGGGIDLCGKTSIKQLAAISDASDLFLGVDSAPMHIAAAVGTPVIALFGPTGEAQWGPWGQEHMVLSKEMDCKPCKSGVCDKFELRKCLEMITKEEVIVAISTMLKIPLHPPLEKGESPLFFKEGAGEMT